MNIIIKILVALLFPAFLFAQGIQFEEGTWKEIRSKAKESNKIIFVDAFTSWCGPCKWMTAKVFTDPEVGSYYNKHFVNYKLDMEQGEGLEFAEEYNVRAYPTLLYINASGQMVHRHIGALQAKKFLNTGHVAMDPDSRISNLIKRYEGGDREPSFLRRYISTLASAGMSPTVVAEEYFSTLSEEDLITSDNFKLIQILRPSIDNPQFQFVVKNREKYGELINPEFIREFIRETCKGDLLRMAYRGESSDFEKVVDHIKDFNLADEEEILTYSYMKFGQKNHDYDLFIKNAKTYTKKYAGADWMLFNNIAWDIYEDDHFSGQEYLELGLDLVKKSVKIDKNYFNTDTYASLLFKTGDYKRAKDWAEEAILLGKESGEEYSMTLELLEKINAKLRL